MGEILEIADGMSWKSRRQSWIRNDEEVGLCISKNSGWINMWSIAGGKH